MTCILEPLPAPHLQEIPKNLQKITKKERSRNKTVTQFSTIRAVTWSRLMVKHSDNLALVAGARAGDRESMDQLAGCVRDRLYPYVNRLTADKDVSEDLVQEVLLIAVRFVKSLAKLESFWPWIYAIARNRIKSHLRNQCRMRSLRSAGFAEDYLYQRRRDNGSGLEVMVAKERQRAVGAAVRLLDKPYRDVMRLRCLEERSFSDIASMTGCSCQQVRVRFFRAKRHLRRRLLADDLLKDQA
jgi:RNA polymerase sigma-70 factor (ECF subfamily)